MPSIVKRSADNFLSTNYGGIAKHGGAVKVRAPWDSTNGGEMQMWPDVPEGIMDGTRIRTSTASYLVRGI